MTFLSLSIEKSCLTQQKDLLEYQEMCLTNQKNGVTQQMANYTAKGGSSDDSTYASLEAYQELYDTQIDSLESQLEEINTEIESYEKAVNTNIKSECKLNVSV